MDVLYALKLIHNSLDIVYQYSIKGLIDSTSDIDLYIRAFTFMPTNHIKTL